jgi:hypothetical protein
MGSNRPLRAGEYVYQASGLPDVIRVDQLAKGGPVNSTGDQPIINTSGCGILCPCRYPEVWDACPVHPPTPPPTHAQG